MKLTFNQISELGIGINKKQGQHRNLIIEARSLLLIKIYFISRLCYMCTNVIECIFHMLSYVFSILGTIFFWIKKKKN